jgi:hypothetical protein
MMKKLLFLIACGCMLNLSPLHAQVIINPVSATATLTAAFGTTLDNAINGVGLSEYPSLTAGHGMSVFGNSYVATNEPGTIDFDLGGSYLVDGLSLWNQNFFGPVPGQTGIQEVNIYSSQDGLTYTLIDDAPGVFAISPCFSGCVPEQISFTEVTASFIRFEVLNNWGDASYVAFSEVAFSGDFVSGVEDIKLSNHIVVYPNPTLSAITISNDANYNLKEVYVYDAYGRVVSHLEYLETIDKLEVDMSTLAAGIYTVLVNAEEGSATKKVIKK